MGTQLAALERSTDDVKVAGVCAALARRYDVDPTLVRVAMLMLALCSGVGAVLYGFAWAVLPRTGEADSPLRRAMPSFPHLAREMWIVLLVVLCLGISGLGEKVLPFGLLSGAMILWLARWWAKRVDHREELLSRQSAAVTSGTAADGWPLLPQLADSALAAPTASAPVPRRRSRATKWLTLATFLAMATALSIAAPLLDGHLPENNVGVAVMAIMVLVLGVGLLVGSFVGKPWALAITTLVMTVCLGITNMAVGFDTNPQGVGDIYTRASAISQVHDEHASLGNIDVDYSGLAVTQDASATIASNVGNVTVRVPAGSNVVIDWSTRFGSYLGPDKHVNGPQGAGTYRRIGDPNAPTLHLTLTSRMGDLKVIE